MGTQPLSPMVIRLCASLLLLVLAACSGEYRGPSGFEVYNAYDRPATRPSDPAAVRVKVSTSRQRAYVMEGDKMLLAMPVSVGAPDTPTPLGDFRVTRKDRDHRDPENGFAYSGSKTKKTPRHKKPAGWAFKGHPLPYWVEFRPGYGFHAGWIKHVTTTNGSIRVHHNLAPKFYVLVRKGTPINISTSQPEDADFADIPLPPDAGPMPDFPAEFYLGDEAFSYHKEPSFE
ncbi:MAG: L,D-transpeptidase [Verrucomicrobiota bacterium]